MELNKWWIGTLALVSGVLIGKNWKKIAAYTTGFYKKNIKKICLKSTKT